MHPLILIVTLLLATDQIYASLYPNPVVDKAPKGYSQWTSPIVLPSPKISGTADWHSAVVKAKALVGRLTLEEKVNLTTGMRSLT